MELKTSKAQIEATKRYQKVNMFNLGLKINRRTEQEIVEKLESVHNKRAYILNLIREDIKSSKKKLKKSKDGTPCHGIM